MMQLFNKLYCWVEMPTASIHRYILDSGPTLAINQFFFSDRQLAAMICPVLFFNRQASGNVVILDNLLHGVIHQLLR